MKTASQDQGSGTEDLLGADTSGSMQDGSSMQTFNIELSIDVDAKLSCQDADKDRDCKGPLGWGIWTKPANAKDPGPPLHLGLVAAAGRGTVIKGSDLPLAPQMYLNVFIDDNSSATADNPLPDKGDPIHLDLDPFTATPGSTLKRTIVFWVRMP